MDFDETVSDSDSDAFRSAMAEGTSSGFNFDIMSSMVMTDAVGRWFSFCWTDLFVTDAYDVVDEVD